jgi:hypothetical protein
VEHAPPLRELQALFWRALRGDRDPALERLVAGTASLPADARVGIYEHMYAARLADVLRDDFEHTAAALGPDRFAELARAYLAAHPSEHPSVRHLGRHFVRFLVSAPPVGAPPWLIDLARLEWARVEVFDAPDETPIGLEALRELAQEDWPGLVLVPIAALERVESAWPVHRIWRGDGDPVPEATAIRIWRQDGVVYHAAMDAVEREALALLRTGERFAGICEALGHLDDATAAAEAGALLARWVEDGLIARLR